MTISDKNRYRVDVYGERLRNRVAQLPAGLQTVAWYINDNRQRVLDSTALDIAALTGTSDATVIRAVQGLGFAGLRDLKKPCTAGLSRS